MHLWKGLFFCMWMSDKPLTQEKLAESLASLLHSFDKKDVSIRFYGAFLKIMGKEWFGIDQWRIDKFMMVMKVFAAVFLRFNTGYDTLCISRVFFFIVSKGFYK